MDRKTITAFLLIAVLLLLYPLYMQWLGLGKKSTTPVTTGQDTTTVSQPTSLPEKIVSQPAEKESIRPPGFATKAPEPEKEVTVETPLYKAVFSSRGGSLKSFVLKKYVDYNKGEIDLIKNGQEAYNLDVVFPDSSFALSALNFTPDKLNLKLAGKGQKGEVTFKYSGSGLAVTRSYILYSDKYTLELGLSVETQTGLLGRKYLLTWNSGLPTTEKNLGEDLSYFATYAYLGGELLENKGPKNDSLQESSGSGKTVWVASRSKYFVASLISPDSSASGFSTTGQNMYILQNGQKVLVGKRLTVGLEKEIPNQPGFSHKYLIHIGPLDYWALRKYGLELEHMVNLGWVLFKPFAIGILWFFVHLYKVVPNYGVVIILFTLLMKIIFFPLSRKMTKTSLMMAEMAPKISKLKEKYKDDKQKLNQEIFKLYKEHGINPLGGCLPLLIQIPIFWAFFVLLRTTIELRQAPFLGWIEDLSLKDPYYILPILMTVAMFFQQRMTIKDPRQKMMVYLMPGIFFFMFMSFPAGLTLYWTIYNILSVFEQYMIRSQMQPIVHTED